MPRLDAVVMSLGFGAWLGFSMSMFLHVGVTMLTASLPRSRTMAEKGLALVTRLLAIAMAFSGLTAFAIFEGQLNPAADVTFYGLIAGVASYVVVVKVYRKLTFTGNQSGKT
jgi:hypothetical protein